MSNKCSQILQGKRRSVEDSPLIRAKPKAQRMGQDLISWMEAIRPQGVAYAGDWHTRAMAFGAKNIIAIGSPTMYAHSNLTLTIAKY